MTRIGRHKFENVPYTYNTYIYLLLDRLTESVSLKHQVTRALLGIRRRCNLPNLQQKGVLVDIGSKFSRVL